jgi:metal-dependent hydrolase (beta-lactamase superfamily II)
MVVPALAHLTAPRASRTIAGEAPVDDDDKLRDEIKALLSDGLETEVFPRADTHEQVQEVVARLQAAKGDLKQRLIIGGFTLTPIEHEGIEQICETCMYYKVHRRYCELPELEVPVEPEWSCRLWRI